MDPMRVNLCATLLSCIGLFLGMEGCQSPPPWNVPPGLESGARVRVVSPRVGTAWQPGRVVLSSVITVVPEEKEGWADMLPSDLEHASASKCGRT
jgi:hypothetical protein